MAVLVTYRGLSVLDTASQPGGNAINNNLRELANRAGPIYSTTSNPTVNDDGVGTAGNGSFFEWSKWRNTTTDQLWMLRSNGTGVADWVEFSNWNQNGAGTFNDGSDTANAGGDAAISTYITASGSGSFAHGHAYDIGSDIIASANGSTAIGSSTGGGQILSSGFGSLAGGYSKGVNSVISNNSGSFAWGYATTGGSITSSAYGSIAGGYTDFYAVTASGNGSLAWGHADSAAIAASASNAFQFGPGTNALADTVQVGSAGLRFKQTTAAPGAPQNGDFWVASTNVYVRTNGVSVNLTDSTGDWNRSGLGTFSDNSDASNAGGYAATSTIIGTATASGSFAHGHVAGSGDIYANGDGSAALGKAVGTGGQIISSGDGSFSGGYLNSAYNITASEDGSFAWGKANSAAILSSGIGSFAGGYAYTSDVTASGAGSFAWGRATAAITASANNAFQLGVGVNATADTVQIGNGGLRFKQTTAAPGAPQDGDFWVAATNVYARTGGATINLSDTVSDWNRSGAGTFADNSDSANVGGRANAGTFITASAYGALAHGHASTAGSDIIASQLGAVAMGASTGAGQILANGYGSLAAGYSNSANTLSAGGQGTIALGMAYNANIAAAGNGTIAGGYAGVAAQTITTSGNGSFAWGSADAASIAATANNAFQFGPGTNALADTVQVGNGGLRFSQNAAAPGAPQDGDFWVASTNVYARTGGATVNLSAVSSEWNRDGSGTFNDNTNTANVGGSAVTGGSITTSGGTGAFAHGNAATTGSVIGATAAGAFAVGQARNGYDISASNNAAFAFGNALSASITASGPGAFAGGSCDNGNAILASGEGSIAMGYAYNGAITASQPGAIQFGPGTNATADTLQIGNAGLRFKQTTLAPSPLQDGDFWIASSNVYVRTNGVSVNLSDSTGDWNRSGLGTFTDNSDASNVGGYAATSRTIGVSTGTGAFAHGRATGSDIIASGSGAFATGYTHSIGTTANITASGGGSFASGMTRTVGGAITASGNGSMALGYTAASGAHTIVASVPGAIAMGGSGSGGTGSILSSGFGCLAGGYVNSTGNVASSGYGSLAWGCSYGANITSSGYGSLAGGYSSSFAITASGNGSFAWGYAVSAAIVATGDNSFQFGPGSNTIADTVQVGAAGIRFKQTTGAPGTRQDGDFWMNGELFIQTPGLTLESATLGNARGTASIDLQTTRASITQVASGNYSVVSGGRNNTASGDFSTATGDDASAHLQNMVAQAGGQFAATGDAQTSVSVVRVLSTGVGPLALTLDGTAAGGTNSLTIPNNTTWAFDILVIARNRDTDVENAAFKLFGAIKKETTSASTVLIGTVDKTVKKTGGGTSVWDISATADVTNGRLLIQATGEVSHNIHWVARVTLTETTG